MATIANATRRIKLLPGVLLQESYGRSDIWTLASQQRLYDGPTLGSIPPFSPSATFAGPLRNLVLDPVASAFRRAEAAHGQHEKRTGQRDANWANWYAAYIVAEQAGQELPQ